MMLRVGLTEKIRIVPTTRPMICEKTIGTRVIRKSRITGTSLLMRSAR